MSTAFSQNVRIQGVRDSVTPQRRRHADVASKVDGRKARPQAANGDQPLSAGLGSRLGGAVLSIQAVTA